ncbi:MAG: MFS transporter, partial [Parasporobacterium sp.]|nr:MFS transporter [Parasporobacterium sp.]
MEKKNGVKASSSNFGKMGWFLIIYMALTFFLTGMGGSVLNITSGMFEGMYGWNPAFVISLSSIGGWVGTAVIFIMGLIMNKGKVNIRLTILICGIAVGISYMIQGNTGSLAIFSIAYILFYALYTLWAQLANQALINNWFPRKKGIAIGWATMGFPLAPSLGLVLFANSIGKIGLNYTYIVLGAATLIVGVIGAMAFKEFPEKHGLFPDNDRSMTREMANKELEEGKMLVANSPWTLKRLLATKEVWMVFIPAGFVGFFGAGSISQVVPRLLSAGYTPDAATGMIAACALFAVPGSFLIGFIDSKLGTKKAFVLTIILSAIGSILYALCTPVTIWPALIIIGIALGGSSNFAMSFTTSYFGRYHFQKAFGVTLT